MKRTTVFFDEQLEREIQALARRQKRPMASVVREAVEQYVVAERQTGGPSPYSFVALGRSGRRDVAERHESLLFQDPPAGPATGRRRAARAAAEPRPDRAAAPKPGSPASRRRSG